MTDARPGLGLPSGIGLGIGLDIGGTSTKAGIVQPDGTVVASVSVPTIRGVDGVLAGAQAAAMEVVRAAGISLIDVDAIGVGVPGSVDRSRGTVRHAVNLGIGQQAVELGDVLAAAFGVQVHVDNDVRAAALGADWWVAREHGPVDDLAYLSVGTGIAAGYVDHGQVHRGGRMAAGEIGHLPIDPEGPECACGQVGCLEAVASGSAIARMWPAPDGPDAPSSERWPARALHDAARDGDQRAAPLWSSVVAGLARAVLVLGLTWDPDIVIISGGVAALGADLQAAIEAQLREEARRADFLRSLDLAARVCVVEPTVPLGPIGAVRMARAASAAAR